MVFLRIKNVNGWNYAYLVRNDWVPGKGSRQTVVHYVGKVRHDVKIDAGAVFERDRFECQRCKTIDNLTIDHVVPTSKGGTNNFDNLQVLCEKCNAKKGNDIIDYR